MNSKNKLALIVLACAAPLAAVARDTIVQVPLQAVLDMPEAKQKLDGTVRFYLAGSKTPRILQKMGEDVTNDKTNGFNKTADEGCKRVALSALIALQHGAKRDGANAVVDIVSYYRQEVSSSPTDIECHDGTFTAAVALRGSYAKVAP